MKLEMAQELLSYSTWANGRMLETVSHLDARAFSRELGGSYPSVQATLTHMLWAEWLWLERWQDRSPMELFEPSQFASVGSIRDRWQSVHAGQRAFVTSLSDERLLRIAATPERRNVGVRALAAVAPRVQPLDLSPGPSDEHAAAPGHRDFWWDEGR
jgi:uncharacterized damage-inducible protein DinB